MPTPLYVAEGLRPEFSKKSALIILGGGVAAVTMIAAYFGGGYPRLGGVIVNSGASVLSLPAPFPVKKENNNAAPPTNPVATSSSQPSATNSSQPVASPSATSSGKKSGM